MSQFKNRNEKEEKRLYNANGRTLLQNWVEERAVDPFDKLPEDPKLKKEALLTTNISGHRGILSINNGLRENKKSTYEDSFIKNDHNCMKSEEKGIRYRITEQMLFKQLEEELEKEENLKNDWTDEPTKFISETHEKFFVPNFVSTDPAPTAPHDVYSEMPISFWTEKKSCINGVTQVKTFDSPFRRNTAFTKPIGESYDQAKPYELENYPFTSQSMNNNAPLF